MNYQEMAQQFPHLDGEERNTILHFCSAIGEAQKQSIAAERQVILLIERLYNTLLDIPIESELRPIFQAKLLNIAGIYALIPVSKVRKRVKPRRHPDTGKSPRLPDSDEEFYGRKWEIGSSCLAELEQMAKLFFWAGGEDWSYLDALLAEVDFVIFQPDIEEDLQTPMPISSTSESLSRTIFVNTTEEGEPRDEVSIAFDIVYQAQFCNIFHEAPKDYGFPYCEMVARHAAGDFIDRIVAHHKEHANLSNEYLKYLETLVQINRKRLKEIS